MQRRRAQPRLSRSISGTARRHPRHWLDVFKGADLRLLTATAEPAPQPVLPSHQRARLRDVQLALVETLGEPEQCSSSATRCIEHQGVLVRDCPLRRRMVERNDGNHWCGEMPLDLLSRVMEALVVPIQDQAYLLALNAQHSLELVELSARMPQSDKVACGDQQHVLGARESGAVACSRDLHAEQL